MHTPVRALGARLRPVLLAGLVALALAGSGAAHADSLLALLKQPGSIAFMRHAWAPFENQPAGRSFTPEELRDCSLQRNLDDKGRAQSRRINALFRQEGVTFEHVYTSAWCRCRETADLIMGRAVANLPLINSFYSNPDKTVGPRQIGELKAWMTANIKPGERALMVTHGSLITALTGIDTDETEIVVVRLDGKGGVTVAGRGVP